MPSDPQGAEVPKEAPVAKARRQPRSSRKSRERWQEILTASSELFVQHGFFAASMQDISDRVGIKKASLYYYVKSKEDLLFEILKDLHEGSEALVNAINFETQDPLGELRSLLTHISIYSGKHADRMRIFARDFDYLTDEQQREIISERRIYRNAVQRLIERSIAVGTVSKDLDVATASQTVINAVAAISQWYKPEGGQQIERIAVQTSEMLTQGLRNFGKP